MSVSPQKRAERNWWLFLALALLLGAALRLVFPGDIEYGGDSQYTFEAVREIQTTGKWPALGMLSGVTLRNPGMSVWVFGALSKITGASTPPALARCVQGLNLLALLLLAFFSSRIIPKGEREPWAWATVLAAVNPFAVLWQRKIWAQSTLPIFCVLFWMAWYFRTKRVGAFFWGFLGVLMAQIHMSGFFLAAGVALWTSYREKRLPPVFWWIGSLLAAIPLLPWLQYMAAGPGTVYHWSSLLWILYPRYWFYWLMTPMGLDLVYTFKTVTFMDFLRYPLLGGHGTYLVGLLHAGLIAAAVWVPVRALRTKTPLVGLKDKSETGTAIQSGMVAAGVLMTLSCIRVCRHYLIMVFPLDGVWLSRLALSDKRRGQKVLMGIWVAELLISACFLVYIHVNHGDPLGDYGIAYQFQGP